MLWTPLGVVNSPSALAISWRALRWMIHPVSEFVTPRCYKIRKEMSFVDFVGLLIRGIEGVALPKH